MICFYVPIHFGVLNVNVYSMRTNFLSLHPPSRLLVALASGRSGTRKRQPDLTRKFLNSLTRVTRTEIRALLIRGGLIVEGDLHSVFAKLARAWYCRNATHLLNCL